MTTKPPIHDSPLGDRLLLKQLAERRRAQGYARGDQQDRRGGSVEPRSGASGAQHPEIAAWALVLIVAGTLGSVVYFLGRVGGWW